MIDVDRDIQELKRYYDSLAGYQRLFMRLFVSSKLGDALSKPSIDPSQVCLAFREIKPVFTRLFSGLTVFAASTTFAFYTKALDTLYSFGIQPSKANLDKLLSGSDPIDSIQQIDEHLASFDKSGKLPGIENAQHVFDVLVDNPTHDTTQAGCYLLLNNVNILTPNNRRDVESDPQQNNLEHGLRILFEDGLVRDADAQRVFDLFMSSYRSPERVEGASLLKELMRAGLLGEEVAQKNHAEARRDDQLSACLILKILNDRKCPVSQARFEKIMKLSPNVRALLVEEITKYSADEYATSLLWTDRYFDKAIELLSKIDANPAWIGREYLVSALDGYKLEIRHAEGKTTMDALQQNGLFRADETAEDGQHTLSSSGETPHARQ